MKRQLLTAMAVVLSVCGYAQTKGTNALGFGLGIGSTKTEANQITTETKTANFSVGYGYFIKDNTKIGADFYYGRTRNETSADYETDNIGGLVTYQQYYPLLNKLYAFAAGTTGYSKVEQNLPNGTGYDQEYKTQLYTLGASGGISWFFSKRFALETTLLNANLGYRTTKLMNSQNNTKSTDFNISTQGSLTNLGFKIYLLF